MGSLKVEDVLRMVGGVGKTSYTNNSRLQKAVLIRARPSLEENLRDLYSTQLPQCVKIAELGSSSGPNALTVLSDIITVTDMCYRDKNHPAPDLKVFLNDLPGNDFNTIFRSLPSFFRDLEEEKGRNLGACFISGTPGSFYGRLFPKNFLHFVHSSYSLHWLSEVPKGLVGNNEAEAMKSNICVTKGVPLITKAYQEQFGDDFTLFLRSRAEEIVSGGRMVLTIKGSTEAEDDMWDIQLLGMALMDMVAEGLIQEEKFRKFYIPFHAPTAADVRKLIEAEGSFTLCRLETFTVNWDVQAETLDLHTKAKFMAGTYRAVAEPLLITNFGESVVEELFDRFIGRIEKEMAMMKYEYLSLVISMIRKKQ
ncbi:hypothetical protein Dimus_002307 [Dionaea muscipula]